MHQYINRIADILRRDDGISGAMHYAEQISWILFLKFLNDQEQAKEVDAFLGGKEYKPIFDEQYTWKNWAITLNAQGKIDHKLLKSGQDLIHFVNTELFPYLKSFKQFENTQTIEYKIGAIFEFIDNRIANGHTLREVLNIVHTINFTNRDDLFQLALVYEKLLQDMGNDGGNSGEFYTPRPLVQAIVKAVNPQVNQTIYDPSCGTCGFLIEAYQHILYKDVKTDQKNSVSTDQSAFLRKDALFGIEKTPLSYAMGVMNMILHGIDSPNISKQNTLTKNIRDIQESQRFNVILANPPFGGKEKEQIQNNFPIKSNATEVLFLQHIMASLKLNGKCGVVVPEGVLFQNNKAFTDLKKDLLERFNVHTILSLPAGIFLPYSNVKTNVLFFDRTIPTQKIWYYEINLDYKLTKNKQIQNEHFNEFLEFYPHQTESENSWFVDIETIKSQDYDLSAKNPNKADDDYLKTPEAILERIQKNDEAIQSLLNEIQEICINQ